MARRQDGNPFPSEAVQIENLLLNLKHRNKRKIADCDTDADSHDSRDRDAFFQRVQTFSIITWFGKPPVLSPVQCAKYGWVNIESDMLQCKVCRAVICATLPVNFDPKVYHTFVKKLTEKLKTGHEPACKWRSNPTPDSLIHVPTHDKAEVREDYKRRLQGLLSVGSKLPYLNIVSIESQGILDSTLTSLAEYFLESSLDRETTIDLTLMKRASVISLCGWKIRSEDAEDIMTCDFCQRSIGLWNYKSPHWHQTHKDSDYDAIADSERTQREQTDTENNQSTERVLSDSVDKEIDGNGHVKAHQNIDSIQEESANITRLENGVQVLGNGDALDIGKSESDRRNGDEIENCNSVTHCDVTENSSEKTSELIESNKDVNGAKVSTDIGEFISGTNGVDSTNSLSESPTEGKDSDTDHEKGKNGGQIVENKSRTDDICEENEPDTDKNLPMVKSNGHCGENVKEKSPSESTEVDSVQIQSPLTVLRTNSTEDTQTEERRRKRMKLEEKDSFDPLAEHRTWCSWLEKSCDTSPWKRFGSEAVAPWKKILYLVCPTLKDTNTDSMSLSSQYKQVSPVAALGRVRRILNDWTGENLDD